jgi:hypothetical protein
MWTLFAVDDHSDDNWLNILHLIIIHNNLFRWKKNHESDQSKQILSVKEAKKD